MKIIAGSILDNINVGIYRNTPGPKGKFIEVNKALIKMFGYITKEEFLKKVHPSDVYIDRLQRKKFSDLLVRKGFVRRKELKLRKKDGTPCLVNITATAVKDSRGRVRWFDGIIEDVTQIKQEQERFRLIFEHSPIAIWEEDFSQVTRLLQKLKKQKIGDIRKYLTQHSDIVVKTFRNIKILDVNKAALTLYGARTKRELIKNFGRTFAVGAIKIFIDEFVALAEGQKFFQAEFKSKTLSGKLYDVLLRVSVPDGYERSFSRIIVTLQDITEQKRLEQHLKRMAQLDSLTKLLNSRAISKRVEEELIRAKRYNLDLSCLMIDIDYFKVINDKFGHQKGDQILKRVALLVRDSLRRSDIIGRYGGDEFFVILTDTKSENATVAADRLRKIVSTYSFKSTKKSPIKLTISIGISGYPSKDVKDFRDLIAQADKALYLAKASGRDYFVMASHQ